MVQSACAILMQEPAPRSIGDHEASKSCKQRQNSAQPVPIIPSFARIAGMPSFEHTPGELMSSISSAPLRGATAWSRMGLVACPMLRARVLMVKPPLTRIAYPRGRPTVPVLIVRMGRRCKFPRSAKPSWTHHPQPPVPTSFRPRKRRPHARDHQGVLLPAAQGRGRKAHPSLLVKSPPRLGKTREAIDWAIR